MERMFVAQFLVSAAGIWTAIGLLFGVVFVTRWVGRIDPNAAEGSWGFRLAILPGVAALWPVLLYRLWKGPRPIRETAHDRRAP